MNNTATPQDLTSFQYLLLFIFGFFLFLGFVLLLLRLQRKIERREALAAGLPLPDEKPKKKQAAPIQTPVQQNFLNQVQAQPSMHPSMPVVTQGATLPQETIVFELRQPKYNIRPEERQHTFIGTNTGGGKTQASLSMMLNDMAQGAQVYWLNPQYTLYHPIDQPTDLRGLDIIAIDDIGEIERCLLAALDLGEKRKPLYQAGLYVGENVVLYLDETPAIVGLNENIPPLIKRVLLELRKMNIWIVLAAQGAQLSDLKLNATAKGCFISKFVKNLDQHSWRSLFTSKQPEIKAQRGDWFTDDDMGGIVIEHIPLGHPLMAKGYVHTDPLGMRIPQAAVVSSSAGAVSEANSKPSKTSSIDDNNTLLSALMGIEKPVFSADEKSDEPALAEEKPIKNRPNFKLIRNKLDRTIMMMLWAGITKTTIVESLQWPEGENLRSRPQQFKYINSVIEQAAALGIAFEGMAVLSIDND